MKMGTGGDFCGFQNGHATKYPLRGQAWSQRDLAHQLSVRGVKLRNEATVEIMENAFDKPVALKIQRFEIKNEATEEFTIADLKANPTESKLIAPSPTFKTAITV